MLFTCSIMQQKSPCSSYARISRGLKQPLFCELDKNQVLYIQYHQREKFFFRSLKFKNFAKHLISSTKNYEYFLNGEDFCCFLSSIHCRFTRYIFTKFTRISFFVNSHNVNISFATSRWTLPYSAGTVDLESSDSPTPPLLGWLAPCS